MPTRLPSCCARATAARWAHPPPANAANRRPRASGERHGPTTLAGAQAATAAMAGPARSLLRGLGALLLTALAWAWLGPASAQGLPAEVEAALRKAGLPLDAVAVLVVDAQGARPPRVSHRADAAMNPASVMKLVSGMAALELLGPAYRWRTPVYLDGAVRNGVLFGNLHIQGRGDPTLVAERLWLLMRRVRGLGIERIKGDIMLDRSAFALAPSDPASFDGEPLRPYNAAPDALLLNYKSIVLTFSVDRAGRLARIQADPPLAGVTVQPSVPLIEGECADYRSSLRADFSDPTRIRFAGSYPAACHERMWPLAYADPAGFAARAIAGMWREVGGRLDGTVRDAALPPGIGAPAFEVHSPPLAEVLRDINKYSNNVMAQQLFLSMSLPDARANGSGTSTSTVTGMDSGSGAVAGTPASFESSREVLRGWWRERLGGVEAPVLDNGSGLSRQERISAEALARLLQEGWQSPLMPEFIASLPIAGVDGTLRRNRSNAAGNAHLKTGSLRDVAALAGYVRAASGRRYVLVAIANHANASASRPAWDALLDWTWRDE